MVCRVDCADRGVAAERELGQQQRHDEDRQRPDAHDGAARAIRAPVAPIAEPMPSWARSSLRSTAENGAPSRVGADRRGEHRVDDQGGERRPRRGPSPVPAQRRPALTSGPSTPSYSGGRAPRRTPTASSRRARRPGASERPAATMRQRADQHRPARSRPRPGSAEWSATSPRTRRAARRRARRRRRAAPPPGRPAGVMRTSSPNAMNDAEGDRDGGLSTSPPVRRGRRPRRRRPAALPTPDDQRRCPGASPASSQPAPDRRHRRAPRPASRSGRRGRGRAGPGRSASSGSGAVNTGRCGVPAVLARSAAHQGVDHGRVELGARAPSQLGDGRPRAVRAPR